MSGFNLPSFEAAHWPYLAPGPAESEAATTLRTCNDQEILAWLAFARKGGFEVRPRTWNLTDEIVGAFSNLMAFGDDLILAWVQEVRTRSQLSLTPEHGLEN